MQDEIIKILAAYLNRREYLRGPVPDELVTTAAQHQVSAIVYCMTKDERLKSAYSRTVSTYATRIRTLADIDAAAKKAGAEYFLVKGTAVAEMYPVPALRTMGDSDIITQPCDMEKMHGVLISCGLSTANMAGTDHSHFTDTFGNEYELHCRLVAEDDRGKNPEKHAQYFNDFQLHFRNGILDPEFHFLFVLVHLRKHMVNKGAGLRQFMDVAVMSRSDLDWDRINEDARKLDLYDFMVNILSFNRSVFDIDPPFEIPETDREFCINSLNNILKNGVFGFDNPENINAGIAALTVNNGRSVFANRIKYINKTVFLPYENMASMKPYSYIIKAPFMLPVAWVHRGILYLRKDNREHYFKAFAADGGTIGQRIEMLNRWGVRSKKD